MGRLGVRYEFENVAAAHKRDEIVKAGLRVEVRAEEIIFSIQKL